MPNNFESHDLAEEFFQRSIRVTQILPLIGLVHHETLDDAWKDFLNNPGTQFNDIIKERFGIDGDKFDDESELARAIMMKNDNGFIVCYDIPVIQDISGEGDNESWSTYGFGHCQQNCLYLETVDTAGLNAVLDHADAGIEEMKKEARAKAKKKAKKNVAKK